MSATGRVCPGCGAPIPEYAHGLRKWCSNRCRKRTLYAGICVDCGAPTDGSNGCGPNAAKRCGVCSRRHVAAKRSRRNRELIERLWAEGKLIREIQEITGSTINISTYRASGYNLPHRRARGPLDKRLANLERGRATRAAQRQAVAA